MKFLSYLAAVLGAAVIAMWLAAAMGKGHFYLRYGPDKVMCVPVEEPATQQQPTLTDVTYHAGRI